MNEYIVNIKVIEDYSVKVEAYDADYAMAEAFNRRYEWVRKYSTDSFEIEVKKVNE